MIKEQYTGLDAISEAAGFIELSSIKESGESGSARWLQWDSEDMLAIVVGKPQQQQQEEGHEEEQPAQQVQPQQIMRMLACNSHPVGRGGRTVRQLDHVDAARLGVAYAEATAMGAQAASAVLAEIVARFPAHDLLDAFLHARAPLLDGRAVYAASSAAQHSKLGRTLAHAAEPVLQGETHGDGDCD